MTEWSDKPVMIRELDGTLRPANLASLNLKIKTIPIVWSDKNNCYIADRELLTGNRKQRRKATAQRRKGK